MRKLTIVACGVAGLVAAAPSQAAAPSLSTVLAHTRAANVALDKAVSEFNAHALGKGKVDLAANRRQIGLAVSQAAQLIGDASTPADRLAAAQAVAAIAKQTGADERALAKVDRALPKHSRLQRRVIHAAAVDTARTTTALNQLNALLASVPAPAQPGLATAVGKLTLTHGRAVAQLSADVTSRHVGAIAKATAAADLAVDVKAQHHAINLLQAIAPLLSAHAQNGVATALAAIADSLDAQATGMAHTRAHAPAALRPAIRVAITRAHSAAADARS
jgi:hypothetical protein